MSGKLGMGRGRKMKRLRKEDKSRANLYPNKMLAAEKEEKASAKIKLKEEKERKIRELAKVYRERYGIG